MILLVKLNWIKILIVSQTLSKLELNVYPDSLDLAVCTLQTAYKCQKCRFSAPTLSDLKIHSYVAHDVCDICGFASSSKGSLHL